MMRAYFFLLAGLCLLASQTAGAQVQRKRVTKLMGGRFEITIVDQDSLSAEHRIDEVIAEIVRVENLISDWIPASQVSEVNRRAGIAPVRVDREVFEITKRALYLSRVTNGAFDISFAAMDRIWKFDGSMTEMPSAEAIRKSVEKVGYKDIILDSANSTIFLKRTGMKIGFGALGEGYAGDRCRIMMLAKGIQGGLINATGDICSWGRQADGKPWKIGIANPFKNGELIDTRSLKEGAVTTSGSYEKYVEFDGVRYAHILNPKTGYPATGLTSVTVFGPSAEFANGLSTSVMVLGKKDGLKLLKRYPTYRAILMDDEGNISYFPIFRKSDYK